MKKTLYMALAALASLAMPALMSSCDQTDAERDKDSTPVVEYVRITNPEAADSLLVEATMGQQIVIMGHDLGAVQEIWFNDVKAKLNPTLITSFSIIVDVPTTIPTEVTNEMVLVTSSGRRSTFPFGVRVPDPLIREISCEYAKPGDQITITGDYFIDPEVSFTGANAPAELVDVSQTSITLIVPEGTVEGPISIKSTYGTSKTKFNFLDTNGLLTNFDDGYVNPWGGRGTVMDDENSIAGKYLLFEAPMLSAWGWNESIQWGYWPYCTYKGVSPVATGRNEELALKFEANIVTWIDVPMMIWFQKDSGPGGNISPDDAQYAQCHWKPWIKDGQYVDAATDGWRTITIPLTDFIYNKDESKDGMSIDDISLYSDLNIMIFGPCDRPGPLKIMMDNFRVVRIN